MTEVAVRFDRVGIAYPGGLDVLRGVDLAIVEGEMVVVTGRTGSGKSTFLRSVNGLVPHFSGGTLTGTVEVFGRATRDHPPRELADLVGFVPQNPVESFVTDTVEQEVAYVMENLGFGTTTMRRRVEETLDLLSIVDLRDRPLTSLSGGQQQRVAIASVLSPSPRVLVLDEPTSSLDPAAAEEVLAAVSRLVHDVGLTVVMAEHRLERVLPFADRVVVIDRSAVSIGNTAEQMGRSTVAPPVVEMGRVMGWNPLPLTIRDARRAAAPVREQLSGRDDRSNPTSALSHPVVVEDRRTADSGPVAEANRITVRYDDTVATDRLDVAFAPAEIAVVMGRNGSGKTTLLSALAGLVEPEEGSVRVAGSDPADLDGRDRVRTVGLVPQDASLLFYAETVRDECATSDRDGDLPDGTTARLADELVGDLDLGAHPRDLSEGQRLGVALALVMAFEPEVLLLDEPTRGLDYEAKRTLREHLVELRDRGTAIVLATHDVEMAAAVGDRAVVLARGEVIADGEARAVVCQSTVFAPQVAKVMAPLQLVTPEEVAAALGESARPVGEAPS